MANEFVGDNPPPYNPVISPTDGNQQTPGPSAPQEGAYSPQQGACPPQEGVYSPQQGTCPPQEGTYSPQQGACPPQEGAYSSQQEAHPTPQGAYPPPKGSNLPPPYAPTQGAYAPPPSTYQIPPNYDQKGAPLHAQQHNQQCPTNYGSTTIVQQQQPTFVAGTTTIIPIFTDIPLRMQCPNCRQNITTSVHGTPGALSWLLFAAMFLVGLWLCCWIPLVVDSMMDIHHSCPSCGARIGTFKRL